MAEISFLSDAEFEAYRKLIYSESGIHFTPTNRSILEGRLKERLRQNGAANAKAYFDLISTNREEKNVFLDAITTNLTRFFRNQPHFDALEYFVLPELTALKRRTGDFTVRIWSAGCSTGEEPYSLAMLLSEKLPASFKYEIVASDLSLKSLITAKEGFYDKTRVVGVPDTYLKKYFDHNESGYRIKDSLKAAIRFDYHNLKNISPWRNFDIVLCRNVLIYFDEAAQIVVLNHFWNSMTSKSFLYIGHSESLFGMDTKFEFVKTQWTTLYKKWI